MSSNYFSKLPYESFTINGSFEYVIGTGEELSLASCDVVAEDKNGNDATDTVLVNGSKTVSSDGLKLHIKVQGGTVAGSPYKITYKGVTDVGEDYYIVQYMEIEE